MRLGFEGRRVRRPSDRVDFFPKPSLIWLWAKDTATLKLASLRFLHAEAGAVLTPRGSAYRYRGYSGVQKCCLTKSPYAHAHASAAPTTRIAVQSFSRRCQRASSQPAGIAISGVNMRRIRSPSR